MYFLRFGILQILYCLFFYFPFFFCFLDCVCMHFTKLFTTFRTHSFSYFVALFRLQVLAFVHHIRLNTLNDILYEKIIYYFPYFLYFFFFCFVPLFTCRAVFFFYFSTNEIMRIYQYQRIFFKVLSTVMVRCIAFR